MEYLDFDLEIGTGDGLTYPVSVRSPAGEAREIMTFPYNRDRMELRLKDLEIALLRSSSIARQILPPELQSVQDMGKDFFNALFCGEVRSRYDVTQTIAREQNKGLRVRLRIQSGELSALPWEYLYDPRVSEYVCLSTSTPLVRYLDVPQAVRPMKVDLPLRILGMICSPADLPALNVAQEKKRMEEALADLQQRGLVKLTWLSGETWSDLQDALVEDTWHVFHFIGHGGFDVHRDEGYLAFTGENGKTHPMHATELARLLADHHDLCVVVLNACQSARSSWESVFSSTAAVLVRRGITCTLAMQFSISDNAAIELARRFYTRLAKGSPVDTALTEARKSLSIAFAHSVEWGTPVLFMRSPDGKLFDSPQTTQHIEQDTGPIPKPPETELPVINPVHGRVRRVGERIWVELVPGVEMGFVRVNEGNFQMGSDPKKDSDAFEREQPLHLTWLEDFWIGRYPVSHMQYSAFINALGRSEPVDWKHNKMPDDKGLHPVVNVSWDEAMAFCSWAGFKLPTEAQWEKAARGTDGRKYPWGNTPPDREHCNIYGWFNGTTPGNQFGVTSESPYGCRDMAGNVREWCADWFSNSYYEKSPTRNPIGPAFGRERVVRGGSWLDDGSTVRCAYRHGENPNNKFEDLGFRVVLLSSSL